MPPKAEIDTLILTMLANGPMHGYELLRRMKKERFSDWVRFSPSSIYPVLKRLESLKLARSKEIKVGRAPARAVYSITGKGKEILEERILELLESPITFASEFHIALMATDFLPKDRVIAAIEEHKAKTDHISVEIERFLGSKNERPPLWKRVIYERLRALYKAHSRWLTDAIFLIKRG